jgi:hypothetical protein
MGVIRFEDLMAWQLADQLQTDIFAFTSRPRAAAGSLQETKNHLQDGLKQEYLSPERPEHMKRLCLRAVKANVRHTAYLLHAKPPEPFTKVPAEPTEPPAPDAENT